jgi:class 3 adenylate cyclase/putative methionine-R-sulfoxide reductase with GAF domain
MAGATNDASKLAREVEDLREQQRALSDVLSAIARSEGLQAVLDEVVEACRRLCEADQGALWLLEDGLLHSVAHQGGAGAAQYDSEHPHALDRTTMAGRTAVTRKTIHIPDVLDDPEYAYSGPRPYRSMLGAPVLVEEDLIGVVNLVRQEPRPFTDDQIALLETFFNQAAIAIANARLIEAVERQRIELSRFVSPQVAELVSSKQGEQLLAGHRAYISCLFSDLRGFTAFAETAAPVRLALAAQARFAELAHGWRRQGTELGLGIGIEAGYATLGRIGFEGRYDYGALGPVTNLTSRLSTRATAGQILIGQRVFAAVEEAVDSAPVGELELKGFGRAIPAYEVRGLR